MDLGLIFIRISNLVWIFPIFRQYKNQYFYFFLFLSVFDILTAVLRQIFHITSNAPYVIGAFLLVMSLQKKDEFKKYFAWEFVIMVVTVLIMLSINNRYFEIYIIGFLYVIVLYYVLVHFFTHSIEKQSLNLFYAVLVLFQVLAVLKFINIITFNYVGYFYTAVTTLFQITAGLFFSFFRPDNPKISFRLFSKR